MALDATEVRIGTTGHLYKAPVGTALPTDLSELAPAYKELGYTETGPTKNVDTSKERFTPWQSKVPVREAVTEQLITVSFTLWQTNAETLRLAWGGGTVVAGSGDVRTFTPPAEPTVNEGVFVYDIIDGTIVDRYVIERAAAALGGEVAFGKSAVTGFPIEMTYLQPAGGGSPWKLITNNADVTVDA